MNSVLMSVLFFVFQRSNSLKYTMQMTHVNYTYNKKFIIEYEMCNINNSFIGTLKLIPFYNGQ